MIRGCHTWHDAMHDYQHLLDAVRSGITLSTSGTTGKPKAVFQTPSKIKAANEVAIVSQQITPQSRIYTVCSMQHAGGLFAQTLPGLIVGAQVEVDHFNPYTWVRKISACSHSHLTPAHAYAIMKTKSFDRLDLSGVWITCGSDPVTWDIIESFVGRGATFMANWGMTEIGPIAINSTFRCMEDVISVRSKMSRGTVLGNTAWCEHKIVNGELHVRGDISVFGSTWHATGDLVEETADGYISFIGRKPTSQNG